MAVSQGLGTTEFTNLIGWNWFWPQSKFSQLGRLHSAVKKLQTKIQEYWQFSSKNISGSAKKPDGKKKVKGTSKLWQI